MPNEYAPLDEFAGFSKIARLSRACVITEKIDGTNAAVVVADDGTVRAQKRTAWCTPEKDNFGFAKWVKEHEDELRERLGVGRHFGEWWGSGIQRGYGLENGDKRFSLFNTSRWTPDTLPPCCSAVPVLYTGMFSTIHIEDVLNNLRICGSQAAPGFMAPEGIVVYHTASGTLFKKTLENDASPKSEVA